MGERGAVGGLDALLLGFLVLFGGAALIVNTWSIVETRTALDAASREYLRAYTEQSDAGAAEAAGLSAARGVLTARGTPLTALRIDPPDPSAFGPCSVAEVTMRVAVAELNAPFIDALGPSEVRISTSELVDAHREITSGSAYDRSRTACGE